MPKTREEIIAQGNAIRRQAQETLYRVNALKIGWFSSLSRDPSQECRREHARLEAEFHEYDELVASMNSPMVGGSINDLSMHASRVATMDSHRSSIRQMLSDLRERLSDMSEDVRFKRQFVLTTGFSVVAITLSVIALANSFLTSRREALRARTRDQRLLDGVRYELALAKQRCKTFPKDRESFLGGIGSPVWDFDGQGIQAALGGGVFDDSITFSSVFQLSERVTSANEQNRRIGAMAANVLSSEIRRMVLKRDLDRLGLDCSEMSNEIRALEPILSEFANKKGLSYVPASR